MKKSPKFVASAVALGLIAAACGSDEDPTPVSTGDPVPADDAMEDDAMEDDAMEDDAMEDDAMEDDAMEDDAMEDDAMEDDAMEDDAMADDETTTFAVTVANISNGFEASSSGVFNTIDGATEPGPATPGDIYSFDVYANPGDRLSFATMFVQSNDWFFAPGPDGVALFDDAGAPVSGDITDAVRLYDAGTEADQVPGEGADQPPRQAGPDTGDVDPDTSVRGVTDGVPAVADLVQVTVTPGADGMFTVVIQNISGNSELASPLAPGAWVVHQDGEPIFTRGAPDRGLGLEALAEDGGAAELGASLAAISGIATPFAPGVWAVTNGAPVFFTDGEVDGGYGLEALAEDGDPSGLANVVASAEGVHYSGVFNTPDGGSEPGPALPGGAYSFEIEAAPGQYLNLATMFVQSNDLFFSPASSGIALFDASGAPIDGDITDQIVLWDAGTEVDEANGFGPNQPPRQAGPNTGADQGAAVIEVATPAGVIEVTIAAVS